MTAARQLDAVLERSVASAIDGQPGDDGWLVRSPGVGLFHPRSTPCVVHGGDAIGTLEILGVAHELVVRHAGWLDQVADDDGVTPRFVEYGTPLGHLGHGPDARAVGSVGDDDDGDAEIATGDHVFRAPTSGRYYGRPSPDKPPFVTAGAELAPGATVCLLEVMKTFHRVTYDGEPVKVRDVLVADGADVNAGDPLLALETLLSLE